MSFHFPFISIKYPCYSWIDTVISLFLIDGIKFIVIVSFLKSLQFSYLACMFPVMHSREKNDEVEGVDLPKAKPLTIPCRKVIILIFVLLCLRFYAGLTIPLNYQIIIWVFSKCFIIFEIFHDENIALRIFIDCILSYLDGHLSNFI